MALLLYDLKVKDETMSLVLPVSGRHIVKQELLESFEDLFEVC